MDSLPPGLLEGRPAGNSIFLTSHQLQQLQQQLQAAVVATASQQHQSTEQVATASGGLTFALHHTAGSGTGVLGPQLLLTSQAAPSFAAYPITSGSQHTTSIQQVLQHHVRQGSILQSTIQQVGTHQTQHTFAESNNDIITGSNKCIPVAAAASFPSRSLTQSPQQQVLTSQPIFQQVMSATGPVLQLYQPTTRTTATSAVAPQKNKPPQQILPKPINNIGTQPQVKPQPSQSPHTTGALLLNQVIPNAGVIVGQQTSSGVQLILKSASPQTIPNSVPKAQIVVSSNGSLPSSQSTVFVQATNRNSPHQVVRLITGQGLQFPAYVAVPSLQPTLQHTNASQSSSSSSSSSSSIASSVATVPVETALISQNVIKETSNHFSSTCTTNSISNNSNCNYKKKKRKEEETTRLDLANLIKISGIDEEDVGFTSTPVAPPLSCSSPASSSPSLSVTVSSASPTITHYQRFQIDSPQIPQQFTIQQSQQKVLQSQQNSRLVSSRPSTPKTISAAPMLTSIQSSSAQQFTIGDDGNIILHQPQLTPQTIAANMTATTQSQLAQLMAEQSSHILQQTAMVSLTGSESLVLKTPSGYVLRQPQMVVQRTVAPNMVLAQDPTAPNGFRLITDVSGMNGLAGKMQIVSGSSVQDQNRLQFVTGMQNPSMMSLTTEQQNHVQILTSVPNSTTAEVSLTEQQQNRTEIISNVPSTSTVHEQKSSIQVIPNSRTVSLAAEQLMADFSKQILTASVPCSSNIHEQNTRLIFQNNSERNNEHVRISSSERTDVHITANTLPETITNQQTNLQMIASLPQNCTIALNEQNRIQLVPSNQCSATEKLKNDLQKVKQLQMETAEMKQRATQGIQVISNLEEEQRYMQVNEEHNRIIVEHQRVLNTSTMAFNEQQNQIQVVANSGSETQSLLQQLEEQRKFQIIAQIPQQQQHIVQLNEQQNKVTVQKEVQQTVLHQHQCNQMVSNQVQPQIQSQLSKISIQMHDRNGSNLKLNNMPNITHDIQDTVASVEEVKVNNQNQFHGLRKIAAVEVSKSSKNNVLYPPLSVINVRCSPSPNRSPTHRSPEQPVVNSQCVTTSCFSSLTTTVGHQASAAALVSPNNQSLTLVQGKPCAAVICNSVPQASVNVDVNKASITGRADNSCNEEINNVTHNSSPSASCQNIFLDTMTQSYLNLPSKTGIVQPCAKTNVMKAKKPKKSAIVKPMVFQPEDKSKNDDAPACLNPMATDLSSSNIGQRVQTIQLTPQKQQNLKVVQNQISILSSKKTRTPAEQAMLQKLFNEQQKILLSGKIVPTVPGQNTQGLTFVSTPVRLVPPPTASLSPHAPSTPPTCNKATSPLHVQVGTQTTLDEAVLDITIPEVAIPLCQPVGLSPLESSPSTIPTVNPPSQIASSVLAPQCRSPAPPPLPPPQPPPPTILTATKRVALITEQLEIDQRSVTQPDTSTPFDSVSDACKRLLRYHCLDEPVLSEKDLEKADEIFEATAKHLLDKNAQMLNKYSYLLCKESMREFQTSELIMLGRIFVADETQSLEQMKADANISANHVNAHLAANNKLEECSILPLLEDALSIPDDDCSSSLCGFDALMTSVIPEVCNMTATHTSSNTRIKRENDSMPDIGQEIKKHCPDDEEINAQVQNAIDSILNLQRSDPATDEAVRSILPS